MPAITLDSFTRGLDALFKALQRGDATARTIQNILVGKRDAIERRPGTAILNKFTGVNTVPDMINGGEGPGGGAGALLKSAFSFEKEDSNSQIILCSSGTVVNAICSETGFPVTLLGTQESGLRHSFAEARYSAFFSNRNNAFKMMKHRTGSATTTSATNLIDTAATFNSGPAVQGISARVVGNDIVVNVTNGSVWKIDAINSDTSLTISNMQPPVSGPTQFTAGDTYQILRVTKWGIAAPSAGISISGAVTSIVAQNLSGGTATDLDATNLNLGQAFFVNDAVAVGSIIMEMKRVAGSTGNISVRIEEDLLGVPSGNLVGVASALVAASSLSTIFAEVTFTFASPVQLQPNQAYWIVLVPDGTYSAANPVSWSRSTSDVYTRPSGATYLIRFARNISSGWTAEPTQDAYFKVRAVSRFTEGGRSYRVSFASTVTGDVSNPCPASPYTGNAISQVISLNLNSILAQATDTQISKLIVWATTDGGDIYWYHGETTLLALEAAGGLYADASSDNDLDFTRETPYENFPPAAGDVVVKFLDSFAIAGIKSDPRKVIFTAAPEQLLSGQGLHQTSVPTLNFAFLPTGGEKITGGDEMDSVKILFSAKQFFRVEGDRAGRYKLRQGYGGHGDVGTRSPDSIKKTRAGLVYLSTDKRVMLLPTWNALPDCISDIIRDELQSINTEQLEIVRAAYYSYEPHQFYILAFPTGTSTVNNRVWIYSFEMHDVHPGMGWFGPLTFPNGVGDRAFDIGAMLTHIDRQKRQLLLLGGYGVFRCLAPPASFGSPSRDGRFVDIKEDQISFVSTGIVSKYTYPLLDNGEDDIIKDFLDAEVSVPAYSLAISSSTNATPIVVTTATAHGLETGMGVAIAGHTINTNANDSWIVTKISATTFSLNNSVGNGVGGATGNILGRAPLLEVSIDSEDDYVSIPLYAAWDANAGKNKHIFRGQIHKRGVRISPRLTLPTSDTVVDTSAYQIFSLRIEYEREAQREQVHAS